MFVEQLLQWNLSSDIYRYVIYCKLRALWKTDRNVKKAPSLNIVKTKCFLVVY